MTPYHGTPITPQSVAASVLAGACAFVSHSDARDLPVVVEVCRSFAIDNGAFKPTPITPFASEDLIPEALKRYKRWAPWRAEWNTKRGKWDKIPKQCNAEWGLSNQKPEKWYTFERAAKALRDNPGALSGLGFVVTGLHDLVAIDLDGCLDANGHPDEFAQRVMRELSSYTEISPSGRGLRIVGFGSLDFDWTNHDRGIEVYGGNTARFLTFTGRHVSGSPADMVPLDPFALEDLAAEFAKTREKAEVIDLTMPDVTKMDHEGLGLPDRVERFLDTGEHDGDRSGALHAAGVALYAAGLDDASVLSILSSNEHAMAVALDHRRNDYDRAMLYLWREHCLKAKPKGTASVASADEFDAVVDEATDAAPDKPLKFHIVHAAEFSRGAPPSWIIKDVLPKAELVVLFGESGSGKSFLALDLVGAIARGESWRGHRTKQGRVLYIAAEGGGGFRKRLSAYAMHHTVDLDDVPISILHAAPNLLDKTDPVELCRAIVAEGGFEVVVVDTFAQVTPGANENAAEDMGKALKHCREIHRITGAVVVLVHHAGKDPTKGARGWSGLRAAADAEIEVVRTPQGRMARISKQKDGEDGLEWGFDLQTVPVGVDEDGDVIDSCVVIEAPIPERKVNEPARKLGKWETLAVQVLGEILASQTAGIEFDFVVTEMVARGPLFDGNGRDTRKQMAAKALKKMCEDDESPYILEAGCISVHV